MAIAWPGICYPRACLSSESATLAVLSPAHFHHPSCPLCRSFFLVCSVFVALRPCRSKTSQVLLPSYCCCHLFACFWLGIFLRVSTLLNLWSLSFSLGLFSVRLQVGQGGIEQEREAVPCKESWCICISRCDTARTAPLAKSVCVICPRKRPCKIRYLRNLKI